MAGCEDVSGPENTDPLSKFQAELEEPHDRDFLTALQNVNFEDLCIAAEFRQIAYECRMPHPQFESLCQLSKEEYQTLLNMLKQLDPSSYEQEEQRLEFAAQIYEYDHEQFRAAKVFLRSDVLSASSFIQFCMEYPMRTLNCLYYCKVLDPEWFSKSVTITPEQWLVIAKRIAGEQSNWSEYLKAYYRAEYLDASEINSTFPIPPRTWELIFEWYGTLLEMPIRKAELAAHGQQIYCSRPSLFFFSKEDWKGCEKSVLNFLHEFRETRNPRLLRDYLFALSRIKYACPL